MRLLLLPLLALLMAAAAIGAELRLSVVDDAGAPVWARFEVRGPDGRMHHRGRLQRSHGGIGPPESPGTSAVLWRAARSRSICPAGRYVVVVERGPEHERFEETVELAAEPVDRTIRLERWIDMNALGWYSGDFHIHRPVQDMDKLLPAEDLNLGVVLTMWNQRDAYERAARPKNPIVKVDDRRLYTILNAEDERGGGAWMLHMLREKLDLKVPGRWYPPGLRFIRQAMAQRYVPTGFPWFDLEKPFWLEAPVVMALAPPDSIGLLHNHFNQYGMLDNEAWGRPRDARRFPGPEGFAEASLRSTTASGTSVDMPASAGSSGVLPNPVGYNRIYVEIPERSPSSRSTATCGRAAAPSPTDRCCL